MSTAVVRVEDASKRFVIRKDKSLKERIVNFGRSNAHKDDFWALRNVNLEIESGSTIGLIGPNGSGKSTLLKLIGGIIQPTSGLVERRGRLAALIELGAGFHPDLTGRENVYLNSALLGLPRATTEKYFDAIVDFSGIERFIDTQVKFYSSGMYIRLAFAVAVHVDPDVLLVDEVLAVGDEPFQRKCMDRIRTFQHEGRTIIVVSHALDQIAELCDRAVVLEHGEVQVDGDPREALRHLRADFEITRQEDRVRDAVHVPEAAPAKANVVAVELSDPAGSKLSELRPGEDMMIAVTIDAHELLTDWILGFGIDTPMGVAVYGTNTKLLKIPMPDFVGTRTFTMRLPNVWLGEGHYNVHGAIAEQSGVEVDRLIEAASFTVGGSGRSVGYLTTAPELLA